MEEKELKIEAILKDKPKGTKLYSPMIGECFFIELLNNLYPIHVGTENCGYWHFLKDCKFEEEGERMLFPSKEMQDWSKFAWKKGDVLVYTEGEEPYYAIFEAFQDDEYTAFKSRYNFNGGNHWLQFNSQSSTNHFTKVSDEEAKAFIEKVEAHYGGKLNLETLEIEKPQFKDGDIVVLDEIQRECYAKCILAIKNIEDGKINYYAFINLFNNDVLLNGTCFDKREPRRATDSEKQQLFSALEKKGKRWNAEAKRIENLPKKCEFETTDWCLMRMHRCIWRLCQFSSMSKEEYSCPYIAVGGNAYEECIPYDEETKHLLGTTDDWEGGD